MFWVIYLSVWSKVGGHLRSVSCIFGHTHGFFFWNRMKPIKCDMLSWTRMIFYFALNMSIQASRRGTAHSWTSMGDEMGAKVEVKEGSGGVGRELKCMITFFRWVCEVRGGRVCSCVKLLTELFFCWGVGMGEGRGAQSSCLGHVGTRVQLWSMSSTMGVL